MGTLKLIQEMPDIIQRNQPIIAWGFGYLSGTISKLCEKQIYGKLEQQKVIVKIYLDILDIRENLQKTENGNLPQLGAQCTWFLYWSVLQHHDYVINNGVLDVLIKKNNTPQIRNN